jgi:hypothetical protein
VSSPEFNPSSGRKPVHNSLKAWFKTSLNQITWSGDFLEKPDGNLFTTVILDDFFGE